MLQVIRSKWWWGHWHVYEVDTGGHAWLATFRNASDAADWVRRVYDANQ